MTDEYHQDLSHLSWNEVYDRQVARSEYLSQWFDEVELDVGDRVLEIGSGPGHLAMTAARRVGPSGGVYAIDRQPTALHFLERVMCDVDIENVELLCADAEAIPLNLRRPVIAFLTYVLHHADNPERVLSELSRTLPSGSRVFVCEHHPDGSGDVGPPLDHRFPPNQLRGWLENAGFTIDRSLEYENESYAFLAVR